MAVGAFLTDGGLGAGLLGMEHTPPRRQLEAVFGFQLLIGAVAAGLIAVIAAPLGTAGAIAAIMAISLPLDCARIPGALMSERRLNYSPIVRAEVAEMLVYNVVAVSSVALGAGIWGVAIAMPCRALVGSAVVIQQSGVLVRPRLGFSHVKDLYRFGLRMQGIGLVSFVRDQGVNIAAAAIAGVSVLGTLSFAQRLAQPIWLVFEGSWRVSYPTMSRLRDAGQDIAAAATRTLRISSAATGVAAVAVAAATPAFVPSVFGAKWDPVIGVMPFILTSLLIGGPMLACASGFFTAIGQPGIVLRAEVVATTACLAAAIPLLAVAGAPGLAAGVLIGTVASTLYLARSLRRHGVVVLPTLALSVLLSTLAAGAGWLCTEILGRTLWSAAVAATVAVAIDAVLLYCFQRKASADALRLISHAIPRRRR
jgi:O-antigen/teichoic acid export membrane protein